MSTVVTSNSSAFTQSIWQRTKSQNSGAAQGDAASQSFPATAAPAATVAAAPATAAPSGTKTTSGGTFPRFEPQTLQVLLAQQATNG
jgi:hypothetical protein